MLHRHQLRLGALLQIWGGFIDLILQMKEQIRDLENFKSNPEPKHKFQIPYLRCSSPPYFKKFSLNFTGCSMRCFGHCQATYALGFWDTALAYCQKLVPLVPYCWEEWFLSKTSLSYLVCTEVEPKSSIMDEDALGKALCRQTAKHAQSWWAKYRKPGCLLWFLW